VKHISDHGVEAVNTNRRCDWLCTKRKDVHGQDEAIRQMALVLPVRVVDMLLGDKHDKLPGDRSSQSGDRLISTTIIAMGIEIWFPIPGLAVGGGCDV
jgi:hypothetical protein